MSEQPSNPSVVGLHPQQADMGSARLMAGGDNCDGGIAITSSARKRNDSEIMRLSALADLRLISVTGTSKPC